ncbi:hypothetical protein ACTXT7_004811 [Hymenolepis weldensis]
MNFSDVFLLLFMAVAVIKAGMIIDTTDACAKIKIRLPYNFTVSIALSNIA